MGLLSICTQTGKGFGKRKAEARVSAKCKNTFAVSEKRECTVIVVCMSISANELLLVNTMHYAMPAFLVTVFLS